MRLAALFSNVTFRQIAAPALEAASGPAVSGVTTLPAVIDGKFVPLPAGDWLTNMPILSGRPSAGGAVTLPGGDAGSAPGSTGDFTILPFPMPGDGVVVQPGEAHILPFPMPTEHGEVRILPMPGAPVSFLPWGSWIGL